LKISQERRRHFGWPVIIHAIMVNASVIANTITASRRTTNT
jgi:hypothetical protein